MEESSGPILGGQIAPEQGVKDKQARPEADMLSGQELSPIQDQISCGVHIWASLTLSLRACADRACPWGCVPHPLQSGSIAVATMADFYRKATFGEGLNTHLASDAPVQQAAS